MSTCNHHCGAPPIIPNQADHGWEVLENESIYPFSSDPLVSVTGYILNNSSSTGSVTVHFLRGGTAAPPLPFSLTLQAGEYRTFTVIAIDTVKISTATTIATGEINVTVNFNPY